MARKGKQKRPEEIVQMHIVRDLRKLRICTKAFTFTHIPLELLRSAHMKKLFWQLGCEAGVCDMMLFLDGGRTVIVELKVKGNYPNEDQKSWMDFVGDLGFPTYLVTVANASEGVMAFRRILELEGVDLSHITPRTRRESSLVKIDSQIKKIAIEGGA